MLQTKNAVSTRHKLVLASLVMVVLLSVGTTPGFSANKSETIIATAMGTSTQMGSQFSVTLNIYDYSTQADKQILVDAFQQGKDSSAWNACAPTDIFWANLIAPEFTHTFLGIVPLTSAGLCVTEDSLHDRFQQVVPD